MENKKINKKNANETAASESDYQLGRVLKPVKVKSKLNQKTTAKKQIGRAGKK